MVGRREEEGGISSLLTMVERWYRRREWSAAGWSRVGRYVIQVQVSRRNHMAHHVNVNGRAMGQLPQRRCEITCGTTTAVVQLRCNGQWRSWHPGSFAYGVTQPLGRQRDERGGVCDPFGLPTERGAHDGPKLATTGALIDDGGEAGGGDGRGEGCDGRLESS